MVGAPHHLQVVDQLRIADQAIESWLKTAPLGHEGKPVPVVFAPPDRAFATMQRLLQRTLGERQAAQATNVPLPFLSVYRQSAKFDPQRFHGAYNFFRNIARTTDGKIGVELRWPYPINVTYQIEVWAKNRGTLNIYQAWMMGSFEGPEMFLAADYTPLWPELGTKILPCETLGIADAGEPEPDDEERRLRFTQTLLAKHWLLGSLRGKRTVLSVDADIFVALSSGEDLSKVEVDDLDDEDRFQPA